MKYTTWDKTTLKKLKENIINNNIEDEYALRELEKITNMESKEILYLFYQSYYIDKINEDKKTKSIYEPFNDDITYASKLRSYLPSLDKIYINEFQIPLSLLTSFVHDFYNSLDKDIAHYFNKTYKDRTTNLKFTNERSINVFLPYSKKSFINIKRSNTIEDFDQIVHEYGHSISDLINYHDESSNYPFSELAPILFHLISFDYLKENYLNIEEEIINYKTANSRQYLDQAYYIDIINKYLDSLNIESSQKKAVRIISKTNHIKRNETKQIITSSHKERYLYVIAFLTAIELYELYKIDPEKSLYDLKEIIKLDENINYYKELDKLNININEHSKEYIKSLKKY